MALAGASSDVKLLPFPRDMRLVAGTGNSNCDKYCQGTGDSDGKMGVCDVPNSVGLENM